MAELTLGLAAARREAAEPSKERDGWAVSQIE